MIKKQHFLLIFICFLSVLDMTAQSYRVSYSWEYKKEKNEEGYHTNNMDMKLDISDGKGVFYNENRYMLRDSLWPLVFDKNGNVKNAELYGKMSAEPNSGTSNVVFIDYSAMTYSFSYCDTPSITINGDAQLEFPKWNITDETTVSREGYNVRKATANYMGREWVVWFTEEVPLPYGPWLLWGAPGLIIMAFDSENLFIYRFMGIEELSLTERYSILWGRRHVKYSNKAKFYDLSLEDAEKMHTKTMTDWDYWLQLSGGISMSTRDRNGNVVQEESRKFIPLIPTEYWK